MNNFPNVLWQLNIGGAGESPPRGKAIQFAACSAYIPASKEKSSNYGINRSGGRKPVISDIKACFALRGIVLLETIKRAGVISECRVL